MKLGWFQLFGTSQNTSQNSISKFFEKKNQIFVFPCCSTREALSINVSITIVGLILMTKFNFELFGKKNQLFGFQCCSTREDLSIDVSITIVGVILTKVRWFQLFVTNQNSNFELFWKKIQIFLGFHCVVLVKTFPFMYQLL